MDLRGKYKSQEPKLEMASGSATGKEPEGIAPQNDNSQNDNSHIDNSHIDDRLEQMSKTLAGLLDIATGTAGKVDDVQIRLGELATSQQQPAAAGSDVQQPQANTEEMQSYIEQKIKERIAEIEADVEAKRLEIIEKLENADRTVAILEDDARRLQEVISQERAIAQEEGERADRAEARVGVYEARVRKVTRERDEADAARDKAAASFDEIDRKWEKHFDEAQAAHDNIDTMMRDQIDREQERCRSLFDQVQDLKGNIRVMCRIRPAPADASEDDLIDFGAPEPGEFSDKWGRLNMRVTRKAAIGAVLETKKFDFERIFGHDDGNETVFEEISDLVQSSMEGKKVCLFAYGQTGSGKTHTMLGTEEDPGIIPRTIKTLFEIAENSPGYAYSVELSIVEIYQEHIHDLLQEPENGKKVRVRLQEATLAPTETAGIAMSILSQASQYRTVASTNANDQSSRSHLILSFRVTKEILTGSRAGHITTGTLNLVDLAGSERTAAAGATGTQMREGVAINSDLMNLNRVITALGNGTRVPYDSALTKALKDSLAQGSRTLMFVMVSPFKADQSQTVQSLDKGAEATKAKLASLTRAKKTTTTAAAGSVASGRASATPKGRLSAVQTTGIPVASSRPSPVRRTVPTPTPRSGPAMSRPSGITRPPSSVSRRSVGGK